MSVLGWIGLGLGALGTIGGMSGSKRAQEQSEAAYRRSLEEKHRAYKFNIGQTELDIGLIQYAGQEKRTDIRREGDQFLRGQAAAIGASGAVIGVGSPLMAMTEASEAIERDQLRVQRETELGVEYLESDIEFMESEIEEIEKVYRPGEKGKLKDFKKPKKPK